MYNGGGGILLSNDNEEEINSEDEGKMTRGLCNEDDDVDE